MDFYWIDPGGNVTQLGQTSSTKVKEWSGLGMAPLEHFVQGLPWEHRRYHRGLKFKPRVVQLAVWDFRATASEQDARQTALLAALNPDRGEGTLKIVLDDGTIRYLDCYVQEGPDFASSDRPRWGGSQFYTVRFVALDPFLYDPDQKSASASFNGSTAVTFTCANGGHIDTYPIITLSGPVTNPKVTLVATGEYIELSYDLASGDTITIDCEAGTIYLNGSTDLIDKLTKPSTFFSLPRGSQILKLTASAGTGSATVAWYDKFLGLGG